MGHVPIDVGQLEVDLLAAPGHKGLLGPLGTGVLYIRPGVERELQPLRCGGTGTRSEEDRQPDQLPDKYEPGNHNLPGLAGLAAATDFLRTETIEAIHAHHTQLTARLLEGLRDVPGITIHGPQSTTNRTSVVSITVEGYDPQELAAMLDASQRIQCRAGLHCARECTKHWAPPPAAARCDSARVTRQRVEEIDSVVTALQEIAVGFREVRNVEVNHKDTKGTKIRPLNSTGYLLAPKK